MLWLSLALVLCLATKVSDARGSPATSSKMQFRAALVTSTAEGAGCQQSSRLPVLAQTPWKFLERLYLLFLLLFWLARGLGLGLFAAEILSRCSASPREEGWCQRGRQGGPFFLPGYLAVSEFRRATSACGQAREALQGLGREEPERPSPCGPAGRT